MCRFSKNSKKKEILFKKTREEKLKINLNEGIYFLLKGVFLS